MRAYIMLSAKIGTAKIVSDMKEKGFHAMEVYGPYDAIIEVKIEDSAEANKHLFHRIVNEINKLSIECTTYIPAQESEEKKIPRGELKSVYVLIRTVPTKMIEAQEELLKMDEVKKADIVYGPFDIIANLLVKNQSHLREIIVKIEELPIVRSCCTLFPCEGL